MMNWKEKMMVMKNKNKLKGTKIFVDNDPTKEELKTQTRLRGGKSERTARIC